MRVMRLDALPMVAFHQSVGFHSTTRLPRVAVEQVGFRRRVYTLRIPSPASLNAETPGEDARGRNWRVHGPSTDITTLSPIPVENLGEAGLVRAGNSPQAPVVESRILKSKPQPQALRTEFTI